MKKLFSTVIAGLALAATLGTTVATPAIARSADSGGGSGGRWHGGGGRGGGHGHGGYGGRGYGGRGYGYGGGYGYGYGYGYGGIGIYDYYGNGYGDPLWGFIPDDDDAYPPNAYAGPSGGSGPPPQAAMNGVAPQSSWYYCQPSKAYYPYVTSCPQAWQQVPTTPPVGQGSAQQSSLQQNSEVPAPSMSIAIPTRTEAMKALHTSQP